MATACVIVSLFSFIAFAILFALFVGTEIFTLCKYTKLNNATFKKDYIYYITCALIFLVSISFDEIMFGFFGEKENLTNVFLNVILALQFVAVLMQVAIMLVLMVKTRNQSAQKSQTKKRFCLAITLTIGMVVVFVCNLIIPQIVYNKSEAKTTMEAIQTDSLYVSDKTKTTFSGSEFYDNFQYITIDGQEVALTDDSLKRTKFYNGFYIIENNTETINKITMGGLDCKKSDLFEKGEFVYKNENGEEVSYGKIFDVFSKALSEEKLFLFKKYIKVLKNGKEETIVNEEWLRFVQNTSGDTNYGKLVYVGDAYDVNPYILSDGQTSTVTVIKGYVTETYTSTTYSSESKGILCMSTCYTINDYLCYVGNLKMKIDGTRYSVQYPVENLKLIYTGKVRDEYVAAFSYAFDEDNYSKVLYLKGNYAKVLCGKATLESVYNDINELDKTFSVGEKLYKYQVQNFTSVDAKWADIITSKYVDTSDVIKNNVGLISNRTTSHLEFGVNNDLEYGLFRITETSEINCSILCCLITLVLTIVCAGVFVLYVKKENKNLTSEEKGNKK